MMNDDRSADDRLTETPETQDLADGRSQWAADPGAFHGAAAGPAADSRFGASGRPGGDGWAGSAGQVGDGSGAGDGSAAGDGSGGRRGESDDTLIGPVVDADEAESDQIADKHKHRRRRPRSSWRELPILIVVALVIAMVIKTFVVQPFFIPSSSMEDTLLIGDKVLVNKLVYHFRSIEPGDIIVFNGAGSWDPANPPAAAPSNFLARAYDDTLRKLFDSIAGLFGTPVGQTDYIKRVIGVPGDHVVCCNAQGLVTVNGVPLHEQSYLYPGAAPSTIKFNIVVPPGRLWVMGDNRAVSDDSRLRQSDPGHGTIPENEVIGRAFLIVWPPSQWDVLSIPATFDQPGIDKPANSAAASRQAAERATAELLGAQVRPSGSYLPMAFGLAGAVPLTWLERRARRRLLGKLAARRRRRPR